MKTSQRTRIPAALTLLLLAGWENPAFSAHELLCAITKRNDLILFYSDAPGSILSAHAVTGLLDGSEKIRAIGYWGGIIYGLGGSSQLYTLDRNTGAATPVGSGPFVPRSYGLSFGAHNGPSGFYVVSDQRQSLVVNRATGGASSQPALSYAAGDPFAGASPAITALAYDPATGSWYAGDSLRNSLATLNPSTGVLNTINPAGVGIDFPRENGLGISPVTGLMYMASPAASSDPQANLYTVNKTTGAVTLVGLIGNPGDMPGKVVLTWTNAAFSLQSASGVTGPWTIVPGATNPYTNASTAGRQFFRLTGN